MAGGHVSRPHASVRTWVHTSSPTTTATTQCHHLSHEHVLHDKLAVRYHHRDGTEQSFEGLGQLGTAWRRKGEVWVNPALQRAAVYACAAKVVGFAAAQDRTVAEPAPM